MPALTPLFRLALLIVLVAGVLVPAADGARAFQATPVATPQAATPQVAEDAYTDPEGLFSVPIPTNWSVEQREGYAHLTDPDGLINVYALALPDADIEAAIAAAWDLVGPEAEREAEDSLEVPSSPGVDQTLVLTYDDGLESGQVVQAVAQRVGDTTYVLLFEADLGAAVRRSSQVQTILSGFEILAVEEVELAGVAPETLTPELLAELEAYIEEQLAAQSVPGAAVAIVQDGEVIYRQGFGVRELGGDEPVTPETLMMIGSTTKPLTTTMMATLVDDGLMEWDTPAVEILPSFAVADPELSDQITMRQLVCACTGVPRRDLEFAFNAAELTPADVIASLASFTFFTEVGEAFQYSNQMVAAGGYLATLAAGGSLESLTADYEAVMQERVFDPIGMPRTTFSFEEAVADPDHASPHPRGLDGQLAPDSIEVEAILAPVAPAGTAWSSVDDMARFVITQLQDGVAPDGERVVSAGNLEETRQPQVPVSAGTSYGLGWFVDSYKGQPVIHHGGNTLGFTSDLAFLPEAGIGIVTLTNARIANLFTEAVRVRLLELAFAQEHESEEAIQFSVQQMQEQFAQLAEGMGPAPDPETVARFIGTYTNPALGEITLAMDGDRLIFDAGEFRSEVRTTSGELARIAGYVLIEGPLNTLPLDLREEAGQPAVVVVDPSSVQEYVFTPLGGEATPTGQPATPISDLATPVGDQASPDSTPAP
jgi:CubicO group peptidase (beta-lactamase class C family)